MDSVVPFTFMDNANFHSSITDTIFETLLTHKHHLLFANISTSLLRSEMDMFEGVY